MSQWLADAVSTRLQARSRAHRHHEHQQLQHHREIMGGMPPGFEKAKRRILTWRMTPVAPRQGRARRRQWSAANSTPRPRTRFLRAVQAGALGAVLGQVCYGSTVAVARHRHRRTPRAIRDRHHDGAAACRSRVLSSRGSRCRSAALRMCHKEQPDHAHISHFFFHTVDAVVCIVP